jgi:hypothetical protein
MTRVVNCGPDCKLQFTLQTISLHKNLDHNSPHVSSMYIPPHTPNNNFQLPIFNNQCYFIIQLQM